MNDHTLFFLKIKMSQNVSSAAVVIGASRVNLCQSIDPTVNRNISTVSQFREVCSQLSNPILLSPLSL